MVGRFLCRCTVVGWLVGWLVGRVNLQLKKLLVDGTERRLQPLATSQAKKEVAGESSKFGRNYSKGNARKVWDCALRSMNRH